jgi:hypothetical protein
MGNKEQLVRFAKGTPYDVIPDEEWPDELRDYPVNNVTHKMKASLYMELFGVAEEPDSAKDVEPAEENQSPSFFEDESNEVE